MSKLGIVVAMKIDELAKQEAKNDDGCGIKEGSSLASEEGSG